jgi:integrase/recombinase XerD
MNYFNINKDISVGYGIKPITNKTDKSKVDLYVNVCQYQKGVQVKNLTVGTGITVEKTVFKSGTIKGRNVKTEMLNDNLNNYLKSTKDLLQELSLRSIRSIDQLHSELKEHLRLRIVGKPPKGSKTEFISRLKTYSIESVMERLIKDRNVSEGRARNYRVTHKNLTDFFKEEIPTIDLITQENLEDFKKWMGKKYRNVNTLTTRLSLLSSIIKYGIEKGILTNNPLPKNFRGSFVDGNRQILSTRDCLSIINFPDGDLSQTELIGKYCLVTQLTTGIGYSDLKSLEHDNIRFHPNLNQWFIEKSRNKTGKVFKVFLSDNGYFHIKKLIELTGTPKKPLNLPSIDYTNRIYGQIQDKLGITTPITTYTLRHTFSVDFMTNDGKLEDLQKILGHTRISTTQIYGKISDKRLSDRMKDLQSKSKIHQLKTSLKIVV